MKKRIYTILILIFTASAYAQHPEIQVIYFQPSDVEKPTEKDFEKITEVLTETQNFFRNQMLKHGYGPKTFAFACKIHLVTGTRPLREYVDVDDDTGLTRMELDFPRRLRMEFGERENTQVIFLGGAGMVFLDALAGAFEECQVGCLWWVLTPFDAPNLLTIATAHELGHTFGLAHVNQANALMFPHIADNGLPQSLKRFSISAAEALILSKNPFFHDMPVEVLGKKPNLEPLSIHRKITLSLWARFKR